MPMGSVHWDVDRRSATLWTRCYMLVMRAMRDKTAFEGAEQTLAAARKRQRSGDRPPTWWTRLTTPVESLAIGEQRAPVWRVRRRARRREEPVARVVYVHGGGYVHPLTADYWRLVRALARGGAEVVVPAYPLAPDHTVDEGLPWLLEVERSTRPAGDVPTVLMGDSAGGALVIALARELADEPEPPQRVVALCPWLDATLSQPEVTDLESSDPMLAESGLRAAGAWWAGDRSPDDPAVSPLNGDLDALPRLDVYIGDRDILRPAVDDLVRRMRKSGGAVHVHETPAMFHVWMTRAIPEGRRIRRELAALVASAGAHAGRSRSACAG